MAQMDSLPHPSTKVTYEGKVWTVSQINLATGDARHHQAARPCQGQICGCSTWSRSSTKTRSSDMTKEELSKRLSRLPLVDGERRG